MAHQFPMVRISGIERPRTIKEFKSFIRCAIRWNLLAFIVCRANKARLNVRGDRERYDEDDVQNAEIKPWPRIILKDREHRYQSESKSGDCLAGRSVISTLWTKTFYHTHGPANASPNRMVLRLSGGPRRIAACLLTNLHWPRPTTMYQPSGIMLNAQIPPRMPHITRPVLLSIFFTPFILRSVVPKIAMSSTERGRDQVVIKRTGFETATRETLK